MVVALHRHPRFMASHGSHGWADWVDGGAWQGAQSALRCPWSREQLPGGCQSVVAGAGGHVGVRSFPGRSTERWASPLVTKGEGGGTDGLVAFGLTHPGQRELNKGCLAPRPVSCASSFGLGLDSQALSVAAERKRQQRWLPQDRGQQARQPAGKGQDREIGAGTCGSLGAGVGVGAAWAGLGWAVTCDCDRDCFLLPFSVGPPAIPVRLRPRPRRCRLVTDRSTCSCLALALRSLCSCCVCIVVDVV